jgi:hypothetical protein
MTQHESRETERYLSGELHERSVGGVPTYCQDSRMAELEYALSGLGTGTNELGRARDARGVPAAGSTTSN